MPIILQADTKKKGGRQVGEKRARIKKKKTSGKTDKEADKNFKIKSPERCHNITSMKQEQEDSL